MAITAYEKVTLDGKEYLLKVDLNAVCELEDLYGKGITAILSEEQVGFKVLRAFYFVALKWKFHNLKIDQVGALLQKEMQHGEQGIGELMGFVMKALKKSRLLTSKKKAEGEEDVHLKTDDEDEFEQTEDEKEDGEVFPG